MYSAKVRWLVAELPGRGEVPNPTHAARRENPICGDILSLTLTVVDGIVQEIRFRSQGCTAALACGSALSLLCQGESVSHCLQLRVADLIEFLQGLPPHKLHGAELAVETLRAALAQERAPALP